MLTDVNQLIQSASTSEWIMSLSLAVAVWAHSATRFLSKNEWARNAIWCRVPEKYRFLIPFGNALIAALPISLAKGGSWGQVLLETFSVMGAGGLFAIGGHAGAKSSFLSYGNKDDAPAVDTPDVGPQTLRTGDAELIDFQDAATSLRAPSSPPKRRLPVPPPKPTGGNNAS